MVQKNNSCNFFRTLSEWKKCGAFQEQPSPGDNEWYTVVDIKGKAVSRTWWSKFAHPV